VFIQFVNTVCLYNLIGGMSALFWCFDFAIGNCGFETRGVEAQAEAV
jgi:hypothetical protein